MSGLALQDYVFLFIERDYVRVSSLGLCFLIYRKGLCQGQLFRIMFSYLQKGIMSGLALQDYVFLFIERDYVRVSSLGLCFLIYRKGLCQGQLFRIMFSYLQKVIMSGLALQDYVFLFIEKDFVRVSSLGLCFLIYRKGFCQGFFIMHYVFLFIEKESVKVSLVDYVFLFIEKDCLSVSCQA